MDIILSFIAIINNRLAQWSGFYSAGGHFYRFDSTVFIKIHSVNASNAVVPIGFTQRAAMIDNIPFILSRTFDNGMMSGTISYFSVLLQNLSDSFERTKRRIRNGIRYTIIGACPVAF